MSLVLACMSAVLRLRMSSPKFSSPASSSISRLLAILTLLHRDSEMRELPGSIFPGQSGGREGDGVAADVLAIDDALEIYMSSRAFWMALKGRAGSISKFSGWPNMSSKPMVQSAPGKIHC